MEFVKIVDIKYYIIGILIIGQYFIISGKRARKGVKLQLNVLNVIVLVLKLIRLKVVYNEHILN